MHESAVASIESAAKLVAQYGYWISFHDAAVESVLIERTGPTVTIHFTTNDAISTDGGETFDFETSRLASVVMRWHEVHDLTLSGIDWNENNWIDGLEFVRSRDQICTVIERMDGLHGFILASRVEVVSADGLETADGGDADCPEPATPGG